MLSDYLDFLNQAGIITTNHHPIFLIFGVLSKRQGPSPSASAKHSGYYTLIRIYQTSIRGANSVIILNYAANANLLSPIIVSIIICCGVIDHCSGMLTYRHSFLSIPFSPIFSKKSISLQICSCIFLNKLNERIPLIVPSCRNFLCFFFYDVFI